MTFNVLDLVTLKKLLVLPKTALAISDLELGFPTSTIPIVYVMIQKVNLIWWAEWLSLSAPMQAGSNDGLRLRVVTGHHCTATRVHAKAGWVIHIRQLPKLPIVIVLPAGRIKELQAPWSNRIAAIKLQKCNWLELFCWNVVVCQSLKLQISIPTQYCTSSIFINLSY